MFSQKQQHWHCCERLTEYADTDGSYCPYSGASLTELSELIPSAVCSIVGTSYIVRIENSSQLGHQLLDYTTNVFQWVNIEILTDPSPGLMLGSTMIFGCCIASYCHRRQHDSLQTIIFFLWIVWAVCLGWGAGASADMTTLGLVPWALCAAMVSSFGWHAIMRWLASRSKCVQSGLQDIKLADSKC